MLNFPSSTVTFSENPLPMFYDVYAVRYLVDDRGRVARVALEHVFISSPLTGVRAFVLKMEEMSEEIWRNDWRNWAFL